MQKDFENIVDRKTERVLQMVHKKVEILNTIKKHKFEYLGHIMRNGNTQRRNEKGKLRGSKIFGCGLICAQDPNFVQQFPRSRLI